LFLRSGGLFGMMDHARWEGYLQHLCLCRGDTMVHKYRTRMAQEHQEVRVCSTDHQNIALFWVKRQINTLSDVFPVAGKLPPSRMSPNAIPSTSLLLRCILFQQDWKVATMSRPGRGMPPTQSVTLQNATT
jgi:hypothetical protein